MVVAGLTVGSQMELGAGAGEKDGSTNYPGVDYCGVSQATLGASRKTFGFKSLKRSSCPWIRFLCFRNEVRRHL